FFPTPKADSTAAWKTSAETPSSSPSSRSTRTQRAAAAPASSAPPTPTAPASSATASPPGSPSGASSPGPAASARACWSAWTTTVPSPSSSAQNPGRPGSVAEVQQNSYLEGHLAELAAAAERIRPHVRRTPLLSTDLDPRLRLKPECFQVTGSFKARGAFNAVLALKE